MGMVPDHWIEEKIAHGLKAFLSAPQDPIWHEFGSRIHAILSQALRDMNQMAPEDPFWIGTNKEPTLTKIPKRYEMLHQIAPEDPWPRLVLWADGFAYGQTARFMVPLIASDISEVAWVAIGLAYSGERSGSEIDCKAFARAMSEVGQLRPGWRTDLETLAEDPRRFFREGAGYALEILRGAKRIRPIP
ncbi:MAG: hypothetical protein IT452_04475 [Planctomycetia bacterium]|nr:hypothetical protein [Planctomycetia bacterium]